jgi:hypothetical protein
MTRLARFASCARFAHLAAAAAAVIMLVAIASAPTQAHKPITSKYNYNADVFPIFRDRCGRCHVAGGAAPMSLLNYKEAVPWAESIREELVAEKMPPWFVDPIGAPIKGGHAISSKEIDTVVTWATGGTPEGDIAKRPAAIDARNDWPAGPPGMVIPMDAEYTVPAEIQDDTREFVLPTGFATPRWVTLADLRPGTPAIVREATIAVEDGPILSAWVPGEEPARAQAPAAFLVPARARLRLRIHYRKPWQDERKPRSDRSLVGLYFAEDAGNRRELQSVSLDAAPGVPSAEAPLAIARVESGAITIVSLRPRLDRTYARVDVHAILPSGARVSLLSLHRPRAEWRRRYWLVSPVALAPGSRIEVVAVPARLDPDEPAHPSTDVFQVAVEFTRR